MPPRMAGGGDLIFVISADYARRTGGWVYDHRLLKELADRGWRIRTATLPAGFPTPSPAARAQSAAAFAAIADGSLVLADQLCLGVLPEVAATEGDRLRLAMIVHHPLALEGYRAASGGAALAQSEREALRHTAAVIATSPSTARLLRADYAVAAERILVAVPGVDPHPLARGSGGGVLNLISVGAVIPRKNHGLLLGALAGLKHLPWRLTLVGNLARAPDHVAQLRGLIATCGLSARVRLAGEVSEARLGRLWLGADLFVSASRHEGYGMAIAEAFAHGVPVVATYAGAAGAWVGRRGAKIVRNDSLASLRAALGEVMGARANRAALRRDAVARRRTLPSWAATAAAVESRLSQLLESRS
ncbi:MAG TPA: glycosyltransferase family 4 protein [Hyphomicrobiaceae bacterium]|nr:glycosyltransferase family 4 protein [Hyphomicrobiaceae bacterium]